MPDKSVKANEVYKQAETFLAQKGLGHSIEWGTKHPVLITEYKGKEIRMRFAGSPSSRNAPTKFIGDLRRAMREIDNMIAEGTAAPVLKDLKDLKVALSPDSKTIDSPDEEIDTSDIPEVTAEQFAEGSAVTPAEMVERQKAVEPVVDILGETVRIIEYNGQRVVTLRQIDDLHGKANGQARTQLNRNRVRFVEGTDYFEMSQADQIGALGFSRPQGGTPEKLILLTERGYGKIIKGWNDDRSWRVYDAMQDAYFIHRASLPAAPGSTALLPAAGDINAVLDLLAEFQAHNRQQYAELAAAQASLAEAVKDTKAGVMGYIKKNVLPVIEKDIPKQPYFDERFKHSAVRDREIESELQKILAHMEAPDAEPEKLQTRKHWLDVGDIYDLCGLPRFKSRNALSRDVLKPALEQFCVKAGIDSRLVRLNGRNVRQWPRQAVEDWLNSGGRKYLGFHVSIALSQLK